jgi:hypothetical protein
MNDKANVDLQEVVCEQSMTRQKEKRISWNKRTQDGVILHFRLPYGALGVLTALSASLACSQPPYRTLDVEVEQRSARPLGSWSQQQCWTSYRCNSQGVKTTQLHAPMQCCGSGSGTGSGTRTGSVRIQNFWPDPKLTFRIRIWIQIRIRIRKKSVKRSHIIRLKNR